MKQLLQRSLHTLQKVLILLLLLLLLLKRRVQVRMRPFYAFRWAVLCDSLCDRFEIFRSIPQWLELNAYQFLDRSN